MYYIIYPILTLLLPKTLNKSVIFILNINSIIYLILYLSILRCGTGPGTRSGYPLRVPAPELGGAGFGAGCRGLYPP